MSITNEIFEKARKTAEIVADGTRKIAKATAEGSRDLAKVIKLNTDIAVERDAIKKAYAELGRMCYDLERDKAGPYLELCGRITQSFEVIEEKKQEIEAMKLYPDDEVDAEGVCCCDTEEGEAVDAEIQAIEGECDVEDDDGNFNEKTSQEVTPPAVESTEENEVD